MKSRRKFIRKRNFIRAWWIVTISWCLVTIVLFIIPNATWTEHPLDLLSAIALVGVPPFALLLLGQAVMLGQAFVYMMRGSRGK